MLRYAAQGQVPLNPQERDIHKATKCLSAGFRDTCRLTCLQHRRRPGSRQRRSGLPGYRRPPMRVPPASVGGPRPRPDAPRRRRTPRAPARVPGHYVSSQLWVPLCSRREMTGPCADGGAHQDIIGQSFVSHRSDISHQSAIGLSPGTAAPHHCSNTAAQG